MVRKLNTTTSCHERSPKPFDFTPWSFLGYVLVTKKCKKQMEKSLVEHFWRPSNLRWKARQRTRSTYFARVNQKLTTNFFLKSTKSRKNIWMEVKCFVLDIFFQIRLEEIWKTNVNATRCLFVPTMARKYRMANSTTDGTK